jgi:hypothetical protein
MRYKDTIDGLEEVFDTDIPKMRSSSHSMEPWIITVSDTGLKVYKENF